MRLKKVLSLAMVTVMLASVALTGCGKDTEKKTETTGAEVEKEEASTDSEEKPVIDFYHGYFQDDWDAAIEMRQIYQEFADAHKDEFTFNAIAIDTGGEGVFEKAKLEIANGGFLDMADMGGWNIVPAASEAGVILDLKPYLDADADFKAGVGVCYDQNNKDGKIYSVREQIETVGFWYNEDLFNKAGAETPDKWKTWADFDIAVDKLVASDAVKTPFGLEQGWPTTLLLSGRLLANDGVRNFVSNPVEDFNNPDFKSALDFINASALQKIDTSYFGPGGDSEAYIQAFTNGEAAMLFNGVWAAGGFAEAAAGIENLKPAVYPTDVDGEKAALMSAGTGFVVSSKLDEAKTNACVEFIKYMTSEEIASRIVSKAIGMAPSTAIDYAALAAAPDVSATTKLLIEACSLASQAKYQAPTMGANWDEDIAAGIEGKYAGLKDNSQTVDQAIEDLNKLLVD